MPNNLAIQAEALRLETAFVNAGAVKIEADILQPADTLLDLYGEDIRARAFVTHDAFRGEYMLRPDFTVPVVQMHMNGGAEPARYTYSGKVFRQQSDAGNRSQEYHQVGYEVFDRNDPGAADAEVFALISAALKGIKTTAITGDIGILKAAILGLKTTEKRKSALLRHIWRPQKFRSLLDRFSGLSAIPARRNALLEKTDPMGQIGPVQGLRSAREISERIENLRLDAATPLFATNERALLETILELKGRSSDVLGQIAKLARENPALTMSVNRMEERLESLDKRGINAGELEFQASFGRSSMEYYDGFVFAFHLVGHPDTPPVATGGRYDALTTILGRGNSIPAVGGVVRPGIVLGGIE